jgi:hypothetical protein
MMFSNGNVVWRRMSDVDDTLMLWMMDGGALI